jgi:hypothetical protein
MAAKKKVAKKKVAKKNTGKGGFSPETKTHLEMMVGLTAERPDKLEQVRAGGAPFLIKVLGLSLHDAEVFHRKVKDIHNENLTKKREEEKQTKKKRAKKKVARKKARTGQGRRPPDDENLPQNIFDMDKKGRVSGLTVKHPPMTIEMKMDFIVAVVWQTVPHYLQDELFLHLGDNEESTYIIGGDVETLHYVAGYLTCLWETENQDNYSVAYYHYHKEPYSGKTAFHASVVPNANLSFFAQVSEFLKPVRTHGHLRPGQLAHLSTGRDGYLKLRFCQTTGSVDDSYLGLLEFDGEYIGYQRGDGEKGKKDICIAFSSGNPEQYKWISSGQNWRDTVAEKQIPLYGGDIGKKRKKVSTTKNVGPKAKKKVVRKAKKKVVKKKKSNVVPFVRKKKR